MYIKYNFNNFNLFTKKKKPEDAITKHMSFTIIKI